MKHEQHRIAPLLQAIDREISERTQALGRIEQQLEALKATSRAHRDEIGLLHSRRSTERRELYRIEKELGRLGIEFDAEHPREILLEPVGALAGGDLSDTRYDSVHRE